MSIGARMKVVLSLDKLAESFLHQVGTVVEIDSEGASLRFDDGGCFYFYKEELEACS